MYFSWQVSSSEIKVGEQKKEGEKRGDMLVGACSNILMIFFTMPLM